jgi:hypothetical protein
LKVRICPPGSTIVSPVRKSDNTVGSPRRRGGHLHRDQVAGEPGREEPGENCERQLGGGLGRPLRHRAILHWASASFAHAFNEGDD